MKDFINTFKDYPMKRRFIPAGLAILITGEAFLPAQFGLVSDHTADIQSLSSMMFVFTFMFILFRTMRTRMTVKSRRLTVFGVALVDFFTGLMLLAITMVSVWSTLLFLVLYLRPTPHWMVILNRSLVAGSGALIVATGAAVFYEMHLSGPNVTVHEDDMNHAR